MNFKTADFNIKRLHGLIDWQLLVFLVLFLDVKLAVKVAALILVYLLRFDFRFDFRFKNPRLPLFYLLAIGIAVFNGFIYQSYFNLKYDLVFLSGAGLWIMCILAIHQIKLAVERNQIEILHRTLFAFFLLNAAASVFNLAHIIWETKAINPYLYQGMKQRYFIGTGDYIKGLTFDVSITNSVINSFGVLYFIYRKNSGMLFLCMAVLLLTGSNSLNILTLVLLLIIFAFQSNLYQKSYIVICAMLFMIFTTKISPQNSDYVIHTSEAMFGKQSNAAIFTAPFLHPTAPVPYALLSPDEKREWFARHYLDSEYRAIAFRLQKAGKPLLVNRPRPYIPQPNLNLAPYQEDTDTALLRQNLLSFIKLHQTELPLAGHDAFIKGKPGKLIALKQTAAFFNDHPQKILTGDGLGNFSSKIAFKATNLGFTGGYPANYVYIGADFLVNHLDVYLNFFSKRIGFHSVINSPNSVYFQLIGEYGIIGFACFLIWYLGYFTKYIKQLTYGLPILVVVLGVFFLEYWFEQLSIVVLAELMLFINIKETQTKSII